MLNFNSFYSVPRVSRYLFYLSIHALEYYRYMTDVSRLQVHTSMQAAICLFPESVTNCGKEMSIDGSGPRTIALDTSGC